MFINCLLFFLLGVAIACLGILRLRAGTLKVYIPDDGDPPYLYMELDQSVGHVCSKKFVLFQVDTRNISSQK